jgi:hypothetical protein
LVAHTKLGTDDLCRSFCRFWRRHCPELAADELHQAITGQAVTLRRYLVGIAERLDREGD